MKIRSWFGRPGRPSHNDVEDDEMENRENPPPYTSHDFGTQEMSKEASAPIKTRELHWVMRTQNHKNRWQCISAYIDPGNTLGPIVSLERVLMLGYGTSDINFDNSIRVMTHKGHVNTIGTITLTYAQDKHRTSLIRDFHIWEEDLGRFDVCFPASDDPSGEVGFMRLGAGTSCRDGKKVSKKEISKTKKRIGNKEQRWWIFIEYRKNADIENPFSPHDAYNASKLESI